MLPVTHIRFHVSHTICIVRDSPFLEFAPLCRVGLVYALILIAQGGMAFAAVALISPKVAPTILRRVCMGMGRLGGGSGHAD